MMTGANLIEGINDPGIFKAVFTLGGPGSGKTTIANKLLGGTGLRTVDIDRFYTLLMSKAGITGNYAKELYWHAGNKTDKRFELFLQHRLGMIIDGTGRKIDRLKQTKKLLEDLGYETMAIFVNTDLKTAITRNELRTRRVDPSLVKQMHQEVNDNLGDLQRIFGNKLLIVDNSGEEYPDLSYYGKELDKFVRTPPNRPAATKWIADQKARRNISK